MHLKPNHPVQFLRWTVWLWVNHSVHESPIPVLSSLAQRNTALCIRCYLVFFGQNEEKRRGKGRRNAQGEGSKQTQRREQAALRVTEKEPLHLCWRTSFFFFCQCVFSFPPLCPLLFLSLPHFREASLNNSHSYFHSAAVVTLLIEAPKRITL